MADRKHSPDVLAELLGNELPPSPMPDLQPKVATLRPKRQLQPAMDVVTALWETEIVTFQEHRGWRPRYVNGVELPNWLSGPLVHDYLSSRGAEGWELTGATAAARFYGLADTLQLYFKRRK